MGYDQKLVLQSYSDLNFDLHQNLISSSFF